MALHMGTRLMGRLALLLPAAALLGAGCASIQNTPTQDLAYDRWRSCASSLSGTALERVDANGRIVFSFASGWERNHVLECLAQADRTGPPLPEPLPVLLPRGR